MSDCLTVTDLGPATERLLERAFADHLTLTAKAVADLLGIAPKGLRDLDRKGLIGGVLSAGGARRYTEADIRAYLTTRAAPKAPAGNMECPSTNRRKAASGSMISSYRGGGFTDRPVRLRVVQPKPSSATSA